MRYSLGVQSAGASLVDIYGSFLLHQPNELIPTAVLPPPPPLEQPMTLLMLGGGALAMFLLLRK